MPSVQVIMNMHAARRTVQKGLASIFNAPETLLLVCRFSLAWLTLLHPSKPFDAMNLLFMAVVFFQFWALFWF